MDLPSLPVEVDDGVRRPVIVLEPDIPIQRLLDVVLRLDGLEPVIARDGATAVEMMGALRPVAFIVDVSRWSSTLERGSRRGVGFLHYLQRNDPSALHRVIVVSALPDRDVLRDLPRIRYFLRKPFNLDDLREALLECAARVGR